MIQMNLTKQYHKMNNNKEKVYKSNLKVVITKNRKFKRIKNNKILRILICLKSIRNDKHLWARSRFLKGFIDKALSKITKWIISSKEDVITKTTKECKINIILTIPWLRLWVINSFILVMCKQNKSSINLLVLLLFPVQALTTKLKIIQGKLCKKLRISYRQLVEKSFRNCQVIGPSESLFHVYYFYTNKLSIT